MKSITLSIPDDLAEALADEAAARNISVNTLATERLVRAESAGTTGAVRARPDYSSLVGVGTGRPGAYGSREAIDQYIAESRSEW